ncbi:MAG: ABC transporter substrate-binding protein [Stellaceae bacterium]|jgi:NitT/TauT family transport system substrate-binding protein
MPIIQNRRQFLTTLSLAGAASLVRAPPSPAAEGSLETTTVRLAKNEGICIAPQYIADELLRAEGFTDIRYVFVPESTTRIKAIAGGEADFSANFVAPLVAAVASGEPITVLAGVHVGCYKLFGNEGIRSIADLKGKKVGVPGLESSQHMFVSLMAAHIGLDPVNDIRWVTSASPPPIELFADGKIDAVLGFPPEPQDLRARHIGRVVVDTTVDPPWSQYFCCVLAGNSEYVRRYPVATKRVLRAILKATDLCATEPASVARRLVDGGFTARYDYALQSLSELPYDKWHEYDAEDSFRYYALRLHEMGFVKSSPQKIIADGTDWRFLNELKRELKA